MSSALPGEKILIVTKSECNPLFPCVFNQLGLENETLFATPRSKTGSGGTQLFSSRDNLRFVGGGESTYAGGVSGGRVASI